MWNSVQVAVGPTTHRGRYRLDGDMLVVEWRGGRHSERCGFLKPEFVATSYLRQQVSMAA